MNKNNVEMEKIVEEIDNEIVDLKNNALVELQKDYEEKNDFEENKSLQIIISSDPNQLIPDNFNEYIDWKESNISFFKALIQGKLLQTDYAIINSSI